MTKPEESTLYARIGGEEGVRKLVDDFYDRVLADPELKPFFEHTPMDKLRSMQLEFFSAALNGPITYGGKPLGHVHQRRGIGKKHFALFVERLLDTLKVLDLDEKDVYEIIDRINLYADEITGEEAFDG